MTCICKSPIPDARQGQVYDRQHKLAVVFHQDCPDHGVVLVSSRSLRAVEHKEWLTGPEVSALIKKGIAGRLVERSQDKQRVLAVWITWEHEEEVAA